MHYYCRRFYAQVFPTKGAVLDVCSSWVSHFPGATDWEPGLRVGMGMSEPELAANQELDQYQTRDLNVHPSFPHSDQSFEVVTCVVSIDYLIKPREVLAEIARVLKPGGRVIFSQSNRCFPTKVIGIWHHTSDLEHLLIIASYIHYAASFDELETIDISPDPGRSDPLYIVTARRSINDGQCSSNM